MDDPIVSRERTEEKARKAHAAGKGRDDHNMNWHAAAMEVWQNEWDRCERSSETGNHVTGTGNKLGQQLETA